ncbi:MAG: cytochrome c-type biogenesis CcmF C-terminal domain-containing protein, partial [Pseudomonadota bacterium]
RGGFAAWTALLAVLAFCFSILGAFLVRSGVLTSVHAFAVDPLRGSLLLAGLVAYGSAALGLFAWRAPALRGGPAWEMVSREGALMLNNLVFAVATATVLLGTLFPLLAEVTGRQMTVGAPYFNLTFAPMMALLVIFLPIVQRWSWGKADAVKNWQLGAAIGAILGGVSLALLFVFSVPIGAAIGVSLGIWLIGGAGLELWRRAVTPRRLLKLPARVWGMTFAHAGLGLFVIGAVIETGSSYERTVALAAGQSEDVAGWTLTLDDVRTGEGPNWYSDTSTLVVSRGGQRAELRPEKRYYPAAQMPTTETAILKTWRGDLYTALGDRRVIDGQTLWTFRVYFNPLIDLVFFGVILMGLGGLLALRTPQTAKKAAVIEDRSIADIEAVTAETDGAVA